MRLEKRSTQGEEEEEIRREVEISRVPGAGTRESDARVRRGGRVADVGTHFALLRHDKCEHVKAQFGFKKSSDL